ncbi:BglG family transcription antiterminator [Bacillota bacterium Lsc_1132]
MTLDQRCIAILQKIVHATSYVSSSQLIEELDVSKRTVYYDVEKINDWLKSNDMDPIGYVRSAGFYITDASRVKVKENLKQLNQKRDFVFSAEERAALLVIFILTREKEIYLEDLIDKLNVSRSTLLADIKRQKEQLTKFNVSLQFHRRSGYFILGEEQNKRKVLIHYLAKSLTNKGWNDLLLEVQLTIHNEDKWTSQLFDKTDLKRIYRIIDESEQFVGVRYTDEVIQSLSIQIFLLIKRFNQGKHIFLDPVEKEVIRETREYKSSCFICEKIESVYRIVVPEDEIYYLATHLLGAKVSEYTNDYIENVELVYLKKIIKNMVDDFQKYACIMFKNRMELERNLVIHLKPAYYRIKYGIELTNPITESLTVKYKDLFILTKKIIHHFEYLLGKPISDDEIAYIAMHFGGWIDKEGVEVKSRKKAIVVCASGIGTSRILQKQIEDLIPSIDVVKALTIRDYEKTDALDVDFVISTCPITEKNVPLFIVNPILNHIEKTSLLKQIQAASEPTKPEYMDAVMGIIEKHADIRSHNALYQELKSYFQIKKEADRKVKGKPMLNELLTHDKIQFIDKEENWKNAIRTASKPLLEDGHITEEYIDSMIESVHKLGPYIVIAPGIALPHSRPEAGVKKIGMSFLQLKHSCSFSEDPEHQVKLIFVLAAIDNETHLKALSQLTRMLSDSANVEKIMNADTTAEILSLINQYSND